MKKNRYAKQSNRLKTSLKISFGIVAVSLSALTLILVIIFNFSKQEDMMAGSPMVFMGSNAMQDTTFVYRGSANQLAIGLVIQTAGEGNPLNITSIDFNSSISVGAIEENIENARLWVTGRNNEFECRTQIGNTLPVVSSDKFTMEINRSLLPGNNYFWLTFDIKPGANSPSYLDFTCAAITLGALSYRPSNSSPEGSRLIAGNIPFYSTGDLLINHNDSWNSKRDGSGEMTKTIDNERNVYFIQSGHTMQCVRTTKMPVMFIENGGSLKSSATIKLKRMVVETGASFEQSSTVNDFNTFNTFVINNGGLYIHNNIGYVPGLNCIFKPQSTQKFLQYGQATFPYSTTWGNVIIASTSRINFDIQRNFRTVMGDMEFSQTGENNYLFCDGTDTMDIGGDLIFSGGNFTGVTGNGNTLTINVKRNVLIKNGTITDSQSAGTKASHSILNIGGNIEFTGGIFDYAQSSDGASEINFIGGSGKMASWTQSGGEILTGNVRVTEGKQLALLSPTTGIIPSGHSFTVAMGASLMCGKSQLVGEGRFVLEDKASIGIGHAEGINSTGIEGNIITGKRVFNSGATYVYYMEMNPQKTGKFIAEPWPGSIRNLTVNKEASSQWVILSQDISVFGNISILNGIVEKNSRRLLKTDVSEASEIKK